MIYFLSILDGEYIKIGYTSQPVEKRKAALQTGNPYEIEVIHTIDGTLPDEKNIHKVLRETFEKLIVFSVPMNEWYPGQNPIVKSFVATVMDTGLQDALENIKGLSFWNVQVKEEEVFSIRSLEKALRRNGHSRSMAKKLISENKKDFMKRITKNCDEQKQKPKVILRKKGEGSMWMNYQGMAPAMS